MHQPFKKLHEYLITRNILSTKPAAVAVSIFLLLSTLFAFRPDLLPLGLSMASLQQDTEEIELTAEEVFAARVGITHLAVDLNSGTIDASKIRPLPVQALGVVDNETLWLARGIYSETKRIEEMELVAWAIRNRVETGYRGKRTYEAVVLDPWQFSAFNSNSSKRGYFTNLRVESRADKWAEALTIARVVKGAPASLRPFSKNTRHYYSEISMVGRTVPAWAMGKTPIEPNRTFELEARRFRFFERIA
jgi:hypothetical protein